MVNSVKCATCDQFTCSVCQGLSSYGETHYHLLFSQICIQCHTIIFTIAREAATESISVHESKTSKGAKKTHRDRRGHGIVCP